MRLGGAPALLLAREEPPALPRRRPDLGETNRERTVVRQVEAVRGKRTIPPRVAGTNRGSLEEASLTRGGLPRRWRMNRGPLAPPEPLTAARSGRRAVWEARAPRSPVEGRLQAPAP